MEEIDDDIEATGYVQVESFAAYSGKYQSLNNMIMRKYGPIGTRRDSSSDFDFDFFEFQFLRIPIFKIQFRPNPGYDQFFIFLTIPFGLHPISHLLL